MVHPCVGFLGGSNCSAKAAARADMRSRQKALPNLQAAGSRHAGQPLAYLSKQLRNVPQSNSTSGVMAAVPQVMLNSTSPSVPARKPTAVVMVRFQALGGLVWVGGCGG